MVSVAENVREKGKNFEKKARNLEINLRNFLEKHFKTQMCEKNFLILNIFT